MKSGLLFALYVAKVITKENLPGSFCVGFNSHEESGSRLARPQLRPYLKRVKLYSSWNQLVRMVLLSTSAKVLVK